jgi:hypothetical protein
MLALSPDGTTLRAVDTGKDPLGGVRNWIATRAGAPAPAPAPVDQAGPSAEQRERLAAWTGPWAVSTDGKLTRTFTPGG